MNDIEKKAKAIVYRVAQAVEDWRERHRGKNPVILMSANQIATVAMGAPGIIDVVIDDITREQRGTLMGCYMDVVAEGGNRVYLAEEIML